MNQRRYFTHYWTNDTWEDFREYRQGEPLGHSASNLFLSRGVHSGDRVFIVTVLGGVLHLLCALDVERVCDTLEAADRLGCQPESLWEADDHIVASCSTP